MIKILWLLNLEVNLSFFKQLEKKLNHQICISTTLDKQQSYDLIIFDDHSNIKKLKANPKRFILINVTNSDLIYHDLIDYYVKYIDLYQELGQIIIENKTKILENLNTIYFKNGKITYLIKKENIIYIESFRNYLVIHTLIADYTLRCPLKKIKKILGQGYLQCHKSFIVNLDKISMIKSNYLFTTNNIKIPIGRKYSKSVNIYKIV